jgi:hypothetical protein
VRSGPGEARTILLLHIISAKPSKQPLMVRTFLKVYMELGSYFLFLQEQIKDIIIMKVYSHTQAKFWYVDFVIISHADRCDLQVPVRRGVVKRVNHAMNLQDLFRQLFNHPSTLEDLGITEDRSKQIMSATIDAWRDSLQNPFALACVLSSQINAADAQHKEQEQKAATTRSAAIERNALEEARARGPPCWPFKVMETCEPMDTIFDEIDQFWKMTLHIEALLCETRAFVRIGYRQRRRNGRDCGERESLRSGAERTC